MRRKLRYNQGFLLGIPKERLSFRYLFLREHERFKTQSSKYDNKSFANSLFGENQMRPSFFIRLKYIILVWLCFSIKVEFTIDS